MIGLCDCCVVGMCCGVLAGPQDVLRVHPHYGRWMEGVALVMDGVAFMRSRRQLSTHAAARESGTNELQVPGANEKGRRGQHQRKTSTKGSKTSLSSGHSAKHKGTDRRKREKVSGNEGGLNETLVAAAEAPSVAATASGVPRPSAHTSAGGGGRWVHIPT